MAQVLLRDRKIAQSLATCVLLCSTHTLKLDASHRCEASSLRSLHGPDLRHASWHCIELHFSPLSIVSARSCALFKEQISGLANNRSSTIHRLVALATSYLRVGQRCHCPTWSDYLFQL
ncbi:hypothetical protein BDN67DRAFT_770700 [Paxillus ammoniavirescens]|nr:hypothetical protein BDN67DRAFT_770700 [Paxillus ammoniavirescens]